MKNIYLILIIFCILFTLGACKKESNSPILGKWQETKIRVYMTGPTGAIVSDTTYSGDTFTKLDYIQFNSNGISTESDDHIYFPVGPIYLKETPYYLSTASYTYTSSGAGYTLIPNEKKSDSQNGLPGASQVITASITNSNSLLIHMVDSFTIPTVSTIVYDSYYTR